MSSPSSLDGVQAHVRDSGGLELLYAQVVVSLATALGLLVLCIIQLVYRATYRARRMWRAENLIRFDAAYVLNKPSKNIDRKIIEVGIKVNEGKDVKPPSIDLPAIVANNRDARMDCIAMLSQTRNIFKKQYGDSANLMSMRCCLSCVDGVLPSTQTENFIRLYELIMFGHHRIDGGSALVTNDDINFLHGYFNNTILKEIRW